MPAVSARLAALVALYQALRPTDFLQSTQELLHLLLYENIVKRAFTTFDVLYGIDVGVLERKCPGRRSVVDGVVQRADDSFATTRKTSYRSVSSSKRCLRSCNRRSRSKFM